MTLGNCILVVERKPLEDSALVADLRTIAEIVRARSIIEATAQIEAFEPDLVMCDWQVSDGTVINLLEEMADLDHFMPVIAFSNEADIRKVVAAVRAGAADYFVTPMDRQSLRAMVAETRNGGHRVRAADGATQMAAGPGSAIPATVGMTWTQIEEVVIKTTLEATENSVPSAARLLRLSPSTIYRKLERFR